MEVDTSIGEGCGSEGEGLNFEQNPLAVEQLLGFGRELQALYSRLTESKPNDQLKELLQVRKEREEVMNLILAPLPITY